MAMEVRPVRSSTASKNQDNQEMIQKSLNLNLKGNEIPIFTDFRVSWVFTLGIIFLEKMSVH